MGRKRLTDEEIETLSARERYEVMYMRNYHAEQAGRPLPYPELKEKKKRQRYTRERYLAMKPNLARSAIRVREKRGLAQGWELELYDELGKRMKRPKGRRAEGDALTDAVELNGLSIKAAESVQAEKITLAEAVAHQQYRPVCCGECKQYRKEESAEAAKGRGCGRCEKLDRRVHRCDFCHKKEEIAMRRAVRGTYHLRLG